MTGRPGSRTTLKLMLLIRLAKLALCLGLASCDQYISIAIVDATINSNSDNPSSESPDKTYDTSTDAADIQSAVADAASIPSTDTDAAGIPSVDIEAAGISSAGANAAGISSYPQITGNDVLFGDTECADRPIVEGCDPAKENTCEGAMQCVVDQTATNPKGICVFYTPINVICFGSFATESCPSTFMCWGGSCRELCLCDADCSTGRCCGEAVGSGGFKLCADC